jgi:hypothetical protein
MARWLADDIVEIGPAFKEALEGKKRFFRKYHAYLSGSQEILSYRILRPRTIRISERAVIIHFHYRMRTREKGRIENSQGKESILVERHRANWRVRFIHWDRDT